VSGLKIAFRVSNNYEQDLPEDESHKMWKAIFTESKKIQRSGLGEGREFIDCPARHKCPIENILLKLRTKAEN